MRAIWLLLLAGCPDPGPAVKCFEDSNSHHCICQKSGPALTGTAVSSCQPGGIDLRDCIADPGYPDKPGSQCTCQATCCIDNTVPNHVTCWCGDVCGAMSQGVQSCTPAGDSYCLVKAAEGPSTECYAQFGGSCSLGEQPIGQCDATNVVRPTGETKVASCQ